jgi:hypothetical protein
MYHKFSPSGRSESVPTDDIDTERFDHITDPAERRRLWDAAVSKIPPTEDHPLHMITGAVLPIWDRLGGQPKVYRLQTSDGERLLGRVVPEEQVATTLKNLGVGSGVPTWTPEQTIARVLENNTRLRLANNWEIKRSKVAGENRAEIIGPDYREAAVLRRYGVVEERISFQTRYFIPTETPAVMAKILEYHPIAEASAGGSGAALSIEPTRRTREELEAMTFAEIRQLGRELGVPAGGKPALVAGILEKQSSAAPVDGGIMNPAEGEKPDEQSTQPLVSNDGDRPATGRGVGRVGAVAKDPSDPQRQFGAERSGKAAILAQFPQYDDLRYHPNNRASRVVGEATLQQILGDAAALRSFDPKLKAGRHDDVASAFVHPDYPLDVHVNDSLPDALVEPKVIHEAVHSLQMRDHALYQEMVGVLRNPEEAVQDFLHLAPAYKDSPQDRLVSEVIAHAIEYLHRGRSIPWLTDKEAKALQSIYERMMAGEAAADGAGDGGDGGLSMSRGHAPTFYSQAERVIAEKMGGKAAPLQVRAMLVNNGVKPDEMKWSGIDDWLKAQKGAVTKEQVLEQLRQNNIQIREVLKGETSAARAEAQRLERAADVLRDRLLDALEADGMPPRQSNRLVNRLEEYEKPNMEEVPEGQRELAQLFVDADRRAVEATRRAGSPATGTRYEGYQLPGGQDYRELLLTLPSRVAPKERDLTIRLDRTAANGNKFYEWTLPDGHSGTHIGNADSTIESVRHQILIKLDSAAIDRVGQDYTSSHWNEPNILAHVRFNTRRDADGNKVLLLEEVQSDWHQQGREKGYAKDVEGWTAQRLNAPDAGFTHWQINDADGNLVTRIVGGSKESAIREAAKGIPDAPFKKTWHELALRRMVRYAAENGYDKLAWTTGAQQNARYPAGGDNQNKIAHGMQGFYDKIIPDYLAKYAKKWGAKVGATQIITGNDGREIDDGAGGIVRTGGSPVKETVHTLDITDAMRRSALEDGQPLYSLHIPELLARAASSVAAPFNFLAGEMATPLMKHASGRAIVRGLDYMENKTAQLVGQIANDAHDAFAGLTHGDRQWLDEHDPRGYSNYQKMREDVPTGRAAAPNARIGAIDAATQKMMDMTADEAERVQLPRADGSPFKRAQSGRFLRLFTPMAMEAIHEGSGPFFEAMADAIVRENPGIPRKQAAELLDAIRSPDPIKHNAALEQTREIKNLPTYVEVKGSGWVPILETDPLAAIIGAASAMGRRIYFYDALGSDADVARLRMRFRQSGGSPRAFDDILSVANRRPWRRVPGDPRALSRRLLKSADQAVSIAQTSLSVIPNLPQPMMQVPRYTGAAHFLKGFERALSNPKATTAELAALGAVQRSAVDWAVRQGQRIEDAGRVMMGVSGRLTGTHYIAQFNNIVTGAAFRELADTWKNVGFSDGDLGIAKDLLLTAKEVAEIRAGKMSDDTYAKIIQNGVKKTQFVTEDPHRRSAFQNTPLLGSLFAYNNYMIGTFKASLRMARDVKDAVASKNPKRMAASGQRLLYLLAGSLGAGLASVLLSRGVRGKPLFEEGDGWEETLLDALYNVQLLGPVQRAMDAATYGGGYSMERTLIALSPKIKLISDLLGALTGIGGKKDSTLAQRLGRVAETHTPAVKAAERWYGEATGSPAPTGRGDSRGRGRERDRRGR